MQLKISKKEKNFHMTTDSVLMMISRIIHVVVNQRIVVVTLLERDLDGE
tara:strand:+ start:397 stop:543 length:147 start_codon:yes stop_codon:yes gene_type:complete